MYLCYGGMTTRCMAISVHLLPFDATGSLSSGTYNVLRPARVSVLRHGAPETKVWALWWKMESIEVMMSDKTNRGTEQITRKVVLSTSLTIYGKTRGDIYRGVLGFSLVHYVTLP